MKKNKPTKGIITQIVSVVVDIQFKPNEVPQIYDALEVYLENKKVVLEVEQILGGGLVRAVAMGSTDGIKRGMEVLNTGQPISVPVGKNALGRIFNVLGQPVDGKGPVKAEHMAPIHQKAPSLAEQESTPQILETGSRGPARLMRV